MTTTRRQQAHDLYYAAEAADQAFSDACKAVGARDRWSLTAAHLMNPALRAAYDAKVASDEAFRRTFEHNQ